MAEIVEKFVVKGAVQDVWDFMMDAVKLATFIPGCKSVDVVDDKNFDVQMEVKVGPISTKPKLRITITELDPPHRLESIGRGVDTEKQSNFNLKNTLTLSPLSDNETEVSYKTEVSITGVLGKFGWGIMKSKAKRMAQEFADNLKKQFPG
jgi:carbon monoxide dehydrogenase subunit G